MPQSLANILCHLTFSTKGRRRLIRHEMEDELHRYLAGTCRKLGCPAIEIGGTDDHVHVAFSLARTVTIAKFVEELKKNSSKWIKTQGEPYRYFAWQAGYGVFSVGASGLTNLRRYVQNQKDHHKHVSFQDEFRALCARYSVEIDERYVWQ
jgi:REP element-mobilizing transposase RayT